MRRNGDTESEAELNLILDPVFTECGRWDNGQCDNTGDCKQQIQTSGGSVPKCQFKKGLIMFLKITKTMQTMTKGDNFFCQNKLCKK